MSLFTGKTLMITGGTGSFGNAVLNRFLQTDIGEIRIFSRDEKKQDDMRHEYQAKMPEVADKIKFYIGDVRDLNSVRSAMYGVDYIFHAAALKQVPSCEFFPMEAVRTNVIGTDNVLTAAIEAGVESVICLSTDKAAYPINAMGITKAIEEKVAVAKSRNSGKTKICCTRYGNVMCSRGSVIPLWIDQIKEGNPITVTEPSMTRFIMSLEEAVDLVLFAFEKGENGDLLIMKAPACTIQTQAEAVCELFGGKKEDIKVIGIRHGEKMYETLLTNEECAKAIDLGGFYRVPADNRGLNYDKYFKACLYSGKAGGGLKMFDFKWKENGSIKLLIIVGTRPEIIRLAATIKRCREYFDCCVAHTGQNYDKNLNDIFWSDFELGGPDVWMNVVGENLGQTCGNVIARSYELMAEIKPDALLVLGDTNSCLSAISAKRLHIPIFHMEAGNRCKDECLPEETNRRIVDVISDVNLPYSEPARKYLHEMGMPKERTYVTGSPMAEVLHGNLDKIEASDVLDRLDLQPDKYILLSAHREENIDTDKNFTSLFEAINALAEKYDMPILYSCHPRSRKKLESSGFKLDPRVRVNEPLGFNDYNKLQMNALAIVSDSGTLPEESSFYLSIGHPIAAVCIRTSTERPEALESGNFILAGITTQELLQATGMAIDMKQKGILGKPCPDYTDENVSMKVVRIIQGYVNVVNKMVWRKEQ